MPVQNCLLLSELLNVISRAWVVGQVEDTRKAIEAISDCNIDGLPEDAIPLKRVGDDLCVPPTHVQNYWISSLGD